MDWVRLGRSLRALRKRRGLRQGDLGTLAGLSRSIVSRVERGSGDKVTGRSIDRLATALGARASIRLDWNGEGIDRLLDLDHAGLVEAVVAMLRAAGWEVVPEATFAIFGERGSVDVLAWHGPSATLLVIEVKSIVPDVQAMLGSLDRKVRLAPKIAAAHGWRPRVVSRLLVIGESRTSRRRIETHAATFEVRFPDRVASIRRYIAHPVAATPLNGLWFLPFSTGARTRHRVPRAQRGGERGSSSAGSVNPSIAPQGARLTDSP